MAAWPLAMLVRLWLMSLRVEISPESLHTVTQLGRPMIFAVWHNRLFLAPEMQRRYRKRRIYALVSMSGDGGWLTALYASLNMEAVRGSSSRRAREAAADAIEVLSAGYDLGITPDGPRGPLYQMKPGAIVMGRRTNAILVLVGVEFQSAWRLRSWDGFHLPKPFSRVKFTFEEGPLLEGEEAAEAVRRLGLRMAAINIDRQAAPIRKTA